MSGNVAVALLNRSDKKTAIILNLDSIGISADEGYTMRDLWTKKDYKASTEKQVSFDVPAHGVVVLKIIGILKPFNVFQYKQM
jgi:alpha-galactosidase